LVIALAATLSAACNLFDAEPQKGGKEYENVLIYYGVGFNNLSPDIQSNIQTVCESALPARNSRKAAVFISHKTKSYLDYATATEPVAVQIYTDWDGTAVTDTLKRFPAGSAMTDTEVMKEMLEFVRTSFPSEKYQLVYSSHGTGYLPEGYYDYGEVSDEEEDSQWQVQLSTPRALSPHNYSRMLSGNDGCEIRTKSIGCSAYRSKTGMILAYEMEIRTFPKAIPDGMHFENIVFDACLMGGIEVAYEIKDICDHIVFSQTEVITTGYDYSSLTTCLLESDPVLFCKNTYSLYQEMTGYLKSLTISTVDCSKLDRLADVCKDCFEKYRNQIEELKADDVQKYYRGNHPWFFDLEDIIIKCGAEKEDLDRLTDALNGCILYKAATENFLELDINHHCGLSMLLPNQAGDFLRNDYLKLAWNENTLLIK